MASSQPKMQATQILLTHWIPILLQSNNTSPSSSLSLAFGGFTVINGAASANLNLQNAVVSPNNVIINIGGGTPSMYPTLTGLLQVPTLC